MQLLVCGSTGLVGEETVRYFKEKGDTVLRLLRPSSHRGFAEERIVWDIPAGGIEAEKLEGLDAVIHLGGASIAGHRWTPAYKKEILESRAASTSLLSGTLAGLQKKPKVFLCASAIGFYGPQAPEAVCTEETPAGEGFLSEVCRQWEAATRPATDAGIRVCSLRMGVILSKKGGALKQMWVPFQLGLGGILGSGEQIYSWIALPEIPRIMDFLIHSEITGAVNMTAPGAVSNREFIKSFGKALARPTIFPVPAFAARLLFGEMADELLLTGARVVPERLQRAGYAFQYPDIASGLQAALEK